MRGAHKALRHFRRNAHHRGQIINYLPIATDVATHTFLFVFPAHNLQKDLHGGISLIFLATPLGTKTKPCP